MKAAALLKVQYDGLHQLFAETVGAVSEAEWRARPYPGANSVAFQAWHMPRTQDWALSTCVWGSAEVVDAPEFADVAGAAPGIGVGIALAEADRVAERVSPARVLAYEAAVHDRLVEWARGLDEAALDEVPASEANQRLKPPYLTDEMRVEVADLFGRPAWRFAIGPANGHVRLHLGELRAAMEAIRRGAQAGLG